MPRRRPSTWSHRHCRGSATPTNPSRTGGAPSESKFAEWSDTVDSPFETISRDRLLDNVTLYWLTATGASAARIYYESHQSLDPDLRVAVPAALTTYPYDIEKHPRPWAEVRFSNIVRWRAPSAGGHFPALEIPDAFVRDLREGLAGVCAASG